MAPFANFGVSFPNFYKDSIALLFHQNAWYWLKVGEQIVVTTFVEQDAISFDNITVLGCPYAVSFAKKQLPVSLGDSFTWNDYPWKFITEASTNQELDW